MNSIGDLRINMFADDCLIYKVGNNWDRIVPNTQEGLDQFQTWCHNNRRKLNAKKIEISCDWN